MSPRNDPDQKVMEPAEEVERQAEIESSLDYWKDSVETMSAQVGFIDDLISRSNESSIESVRIGLDLVAMKFPACSIFEDFKMDKKTEKLIDAHGSFIGALSQTARIIKERIIKLLDNSPDAVDTATLKEYRDKYLPVGIESHMPLLDSASIGKTKKEG